MNFKAFAGLAAWGAIAASVSLILVFTFSVLMSSAETVEINGINVSTSSPTGIVVANGTTRLYNFTLNITSGNNISVINITLPSWPFDVNSANMSLVNTSSAPANIQLGAPVLSGWSVRFIENFTNGGIKTIQLNGSLAPQTINGTNITWFAFNATANITGSGNVSDNQTMTWKIYVSNDTHSSVMQTTTLVDNSVPNIFNVVPALNASNNGYIRGLAAELFQVNVSDRNLNVSAGTLVDGSTNVTVWYKKSTGGTWFSKTLLCYNATGGFKPNGPTDTLYTCNTTVDLSAGGSLSVQENDKVQFFFNASDTVLNTGFNGTSDVPRVAQVDRTAPTSSSIQSNVSIAKNSSYVTLSATFGDNLELANATLATNETGAWVNQTTNKTSIDANYGSSGSPWSMAGLSSYSVNFTWSNVSTLSGTIVGWQIIAKDIAGNAHTTPLRTFLLDNDAPASGSITPVNNANMSGTITLNVSANESVTSVSMVYVNISYSDENEIANKADVVLTQDALGFYTGTVNSSFNTAGPVANGNYTFEIVANDTLNNINRTQRILVWLDNVAPVISITRPTASQNVNGQFTVEALVTDAVRISSVRYAISNATYTSGVFFPMLNSSGLLMNQSGVYNSTNLTNANVLYDGVWNVTVWANDSVNNIAQENVTITIDNVQNAIELDANSTGGSNYINGTIVKSGATIALNVTVKGNRYGLFPSGYAYNISVYLFNSSGTSIFIGNLTNTSELWANGSVTIPSNTALNVIDDGNRSFQFKVYDNGNNLLVNGSTNFTVSVDNTAANYSNALPTNNSFNGGSAAQLFSVSLTEANLNITKNVTLYWDFNSPTLQNAKLKTLLCTGSGEGLYNFIGPNWVCNTTIALNGLGTGDKVYYYFNNSNVTDPNGDLAGNGAGFGTSVIPLNSTVDLASPLVTAVSPLGDANVSGSFLLNITASNTASVVDSVSYRITNNTFQSGLIALTRTLGTAYSGHWSGTNNTVVPGLADGSYRINLNATSAAGLSNTTINVTIIIDNTKPNVTVVRPTTNLNFTTAIIINATVRDSGIGSTIKAGDVQTVQYRLSNSTWTGSLLTMTNTSENGLNFDYYNATNDTNTNLGDGVYNLTIVATDYAGNANDTQYVQVGIDNTAPALSIITPTNGQFVKGPFNVSASVTDAVWVKSVWYRISNGTNTLETLGSAYTVMTNNSGISVTGDGYYNATNTTDAVILGDGSYNITVAANDTVNHVTYSNVTITIDNVAPTSGGLQSNTSEPAGETEYFPGRMYRFNKTFNDTIGVTNVLLQINASNVAINYTAFRYEGDALLGNWSANVTDLASSTGYEVIWYAQDATGNVLKTDAWYYRIAKNSSAIATLAVNTTTWERGTALNITTYSPINARINTTIYANITNVSDAGALWTLSATSYVPYQFGNQNITIANAAMPLGKYNITANTTANENYTANSSVAMLTITLQDSFPIIVTYSPLNNSNISGTMLVNASVIDASGVSVVVYNITNSTNATILTGTMSNTGNINTNFYNVSVNTNNLPEDTGYNLYVQANDSVNNLNNSYVFNFTVDRTAPIIIFDYTVTPVNGSYKKTTVNVNFTALDTPSNISSNGVSVRIGNATHWMSGSVYISDPANSYYNYTNNTAAVRDGLYNFTITANDTAGNTQTNVTWMYVDNTAPNSTNAVFGNTTGNKRRGNLTQDITVTVFDAQTNATLDLYYRYIRSSIKAADWYYTKITGTVGAATKYMTAANITLPDTNDGAAVEYYVVGTDNVTNAISNVNNNASYPLSYFNITKCGALSYCSNTLDNVRNWNSLADLATTALSSYTSLGGNYTIPRVFAAASYTYVYHYNGTHWSSYNSELPLTQNTLVNVSTTENWPYYLNISSASSVDIA